MFRIASRHHLAQSLALCPDRCARLLAASGRHPRHTRRCTAQSAAEQPVSTLQQLVLWLIANGVEGISPGSKAVLYEADSGERGVLCTQAIEESETVFRIPMRLAISDYPGDTALDGIGVPQGAHWSVRLATKLLLERSQGTASPWYPYLEALPEAVWTPLRLLEDGQLAQLQYQPMVRAVHSQQALIDDAAASLRAQALSGATFEALRWAMSIVFSRTFGSAAEGGGVGVRMLVPLADMLNHGGDCAPGRLCDDSAAADNVRWRLVPPASPSEGWVMEFTATSSVAPGEELLVSYGERSNDDFLLHYGFVPAGNVHDDCILFDSIEEALQWHRASFPPRADEVSAALDDAYDKARQAALQIAQSHMQAGDDRAREISCVRLYADSRVDGAVLEAFTWLRTVRQHMPPTDALIAARCGELLNTFDTTLLADLRQLSSASVEDFADQQRCARLLQSYSEACRRLAGAEPRPDNPAITESASTPQLSGGVSASSEVAAIAFRSNKKALLWDCLLAHEDATPV